MATYKLVDTEQLDADLKTVADAIRAKGGTTGKLPFPVGMKSAVDAIPTANGWCFAFDSTLSSDVSFAYNGDTAYKVTDKVFSIDDFVGAYVMGWDNDTSTVKECWKAQAFKQSDYVLMYLSGAMLLSFPTAGVKSIFGTNNANVPEAGTYVDFYGAANLTSLLFKP